MLPYTMLEDVDLILNVFNDVMRLSCIKLHCSGRPEEPRVAIQVEGHKNYTSQVMNVI